MMLRAYAVTADENGHCQEAAAGYEAALRVDPADLEVTVNLAVLYWRAATDLLPMHFQEHARGRLCELLDSATERFSGRVEWQFWKSHIAATEAGSAVAVRECRQLMQDHPDYLEPAFVVFLDSAGVEAEAEAMRLMVDCSEQPTSRGRYVTSMINAVMQKQRWDTYPRPTA